MRHNHKKSPKGFTDRVDLARNREDRRFNDRMTMLNDFCLEHLDEDLTDVENQMEACLMQWFKFLDSCRCMPTSHFCKWAELVSRWNPLFGYAEEELRRRTRVDQSEWHLEELPDVLND